MLYLQPKQLSSLMRMLLKKQYNLRLEHFSAGNPHYQIGELFIRSVEFVSVQIKEHEGSHSADTFVPVKERMVLDEMEKGMRPPSPG